MQVKPFKRFLITSLSYYISFFMAFSPLVSYAGALVPDGSTQTVIDKARNNVPVVNIANPNASGLSHNKFTHYNVNTSGLILNNAKTSSVNTQLGGFIFGNPHLTNNAKVILNEVTSTNRSALNGFTEVAGSRSDLVIANPNGLTINGAGFINTSNVTLTTGTPNIVSGSLNSFNILDGNIAIEGLGLNTKNQTSTSIYTQYLNLNAQIHANTLDVRLGGNVIDYASKIATANNAVNPRAILLDASNLGGMYAGRITLVGTGAGLGVNLPPEVLASTGNISISNDGMINLQKVSAAQQVDISSKKNINNTGHVQSKANLNITAGTTLSNDGIINAGNDLTLTSTNFTNNATIFASNNMNLYTTSTLSNNANANILAVNNLTMSANAAGGKTTQITNNQADIEALNGNMTIDTTNLLNTTTAPVVQGSYTPVQVIGGVRLSNTTQTVGCGFNCRNVTTTTVDTMVLQSSSKPATIHAGGDLALNASNMSNQYSSVSANGNISLSAQVVDNQPVNITKVTTTTTAMYRNQNYCANRVPLFPFSSVCISRANRMIYVGATTTPIATISNTVASTVQAGASITGNIANLTNGNIKSGQTITTATTQPSSLGVTPPAGNNGLFITSTNPKSQFLIETNPAFTMYSTFISSNYMMQKLNFSPDRTMKRVGDAFYENTLIRNSIFAQTGRRFLNKQFTSDYTQYQYLMDNALAAQKDLQLIPGLTLTLAQIAALSRDIVWLEEQTVAGQKVLVPVVYIANSHEYLIEGGKIIAGDDIDLLVTQLNNSGLLEAGNNINIDASDKVANQGGSIQAANNLNLTAQNNIENISAKMKANNISLVSSNGSIINKRASRELAYAGSNYRYNTTSVGQAGNVEAANNLSLKAGQNIAIKGSNLKAKNINLDAKKIDISTTVKKTDFFGGNANDYIKENSTTHLASNINADNINIDSTGTTTIKGGNLTATQDLNIKAAALNILAVNNSRYSASKTTSKGFLSKSSTETKTARSTNVGTTLQGNNVSLTTTADDLNVIGSNISTQKNLALNSAKNINVAAGFDGSLNETHTKKSGWFSGGKVFSKSEDLEGKIKKIASLASLSGGNVSLNADQNLSLTGVNITASKQLTGKAQNITVRNTNNTETTYSKHTKMSVGFGDALKSFSQPHKMIKYKDGKLSATLAKAEFSKADKTTTKTTVVSSNLEAKNINFIANSKDKGDLNIIGSNLAANDNVNLSASGDVSIKEAKETINTKAKNMHGKAELSVTVQHEAIELIKAAKAIQDAKKELRQANKSYSAYKQELNKLKTQLNTWKMQQRNNLGGINSDDIAELQDILNDLKDDKKWHIANVAAAGVSVALKIKALINGIATASSSASTYGFNAGLELEIDATKTNRESQSSRAIASNINANNINIRTNNTATIQGSNLNAKEEINVSAKELNILSSQNTEQSSTDIKHGNIIISQTIHSSGGPNISTSMDTKKRSANSITQNNAQLNANHINITTLADTNIKGANLKAKDSLVANIGGNLNIESKYDKAKSKERGMSLGLSYGNGEGSASLGGSKLDTRHRSVNQQSGIQVGDGGFNITAKGTINLRGSVIRSSDQAIQNNKNQLTTGTLTISDMRNFSRADAKSMGIALSTDMLDQGKYGATKAVVGTLLNNGEGKRQTIGKTVSAISTAQVNIADDKAQQALTGKTVQQTIDSINVDTIYTHLQADKANARSTRQTAQIKQELKQAVYLETVKFADETYRTAYVKEVKMYKLLRNEKGDVLFEMKDNKKVPKFVELTEAEKLNLKPGKDGKIRIFNNGIFNGVFDKPGAAAKYLNQMANTGDGEAYLIHFSEAEKANNATDELLEVFGYDGTMQELMVAGFQHFLEGGIADASNATAKNVELMQQYGQDGLDITAHSRGSDTTGNAMQILLKDNANNGVLSNTSIHYFGPADHAQDAANQLDQLSGGQQTSITLQNHKVDGVGGSILFVPIGNNPVTYGKIPEGSSKFKETLNMLNIGSGDHEHTVHNCYGANADKTKCKDAYGDPQTLIIHSNRRKP